MHVQDFFRRDNILAKTGVLLMERPQTSFPIRWIAYLIVPILILFFFLFHTKTLVSQEESESAALEEMEAQVKTTLLKTGELPVILKAMGTCVAGQQSPMVIVSRIQGIVKEINVLDGQSVESGQIFARLDDSVARGNYEKAQAEFQTADAELQNAENGGLDINQADLDFAAKDATVSADKAELESKHEDELLADNLTSGKAAQDAKDAMDIALIKAASETKKAELFRSVGRDMELKRLKAAFAQARAELKTAQLDLDSTMIRSPLAGRIGGLKMAIGASVDTTTVIAQVSSYNTLAFRLWISPQDAKGLALGFPASIYPALSGDSIPAKIVSVGGGLDDETGLVPVEAQPIEQKTNTLRINESITADITTGSNARGFLVPLSSLTIEDDKASIYLVDQKHIAHAVPVTIEARSSEQAVINGKSLKEGLSVIVDGNYNLPDGAHVVEGSAK
jgi:multidrug efflux pump subunit AcrA (membrane-fusion protein)